MWSTFNFYLLSPAIFSTLHTHIFLHRPAKREWVSRAEGHFPFCMHENISEYLYAHKYYMLTMKPQNFFNLCTRSIDFSFACCPLFSPSVPLISASSLNECVRYVTQEFTHGAERVRATLLSMILRNGYIVIALLDFHGPELPPKSREKAENEEI